MIRSNCGFGQLFRYAVVGLASNTILYLAYLALTSMGFGSKVAMSILYGVGVAQTFLFNKRWSFRHSGANGAAFMRYCIAYGLGYVLNWVVLFMLVDRMSYPHQIVQGVMIVALAVMLFLLQKLWVFRGTTSTSTTSGFSS